MTARKPLCPRCADTGGWIEDVDGNVTGRCPCRTAAATPERERDAALDATADANPNAHRAALRIITDAAARMEFLTANDVRAEMSMAQIPGPVVGAAFGQAARDGLIRRDGYQPSTQTTTHRHPVARWISLIYKPGRRSA